MQIPPQALRVTLAMPAPQSVSWQSGQLIEALVLRHDPGTLRTEVRVGNAHLTLELPAPAAEGTRLTLQVIRGGSTPLLQLLPATQSPSGPTPTSAPGASSAPVSPGTAAPVTPPGLPAGWLSTLLPAQGSQAPLMAQLWWLMQQPARLESLPGAVRAGVEQAMQQLPSQAQVSRPEGLRQAVQNSGIFHEAALAAQAVGAAGASMAPVANLKSVLLSLAARIRSQPSSQVPTQQRPLDIPPPRPGGVPVPQPRVEPNPVPSAREALMDSLRARTDSAVARLVLHQWSAMEVSDSGGPRWLMELPVRSHTGVDLVHLLMEQEPEHPDPDDPPVWRAELALDIPELGPVHIHVSVSGDRVQTRFWAESDETVARIRAALPQLHASLEQRDLEVRNLGCNPGRPPRRSDSSPAGPLLDDHA